MKIKDILKVTNGKMLIGDENLVCDSFSKSDCAFNATSDIFLNSVP